MMNKPIAPKLGFLAFRATGFAHSGRILPVPFCPSEHAVCLVRSDHKAQAKRTATHCTPSSQAASLALDAAQVVLNGERQAIWDRLRCDDSGHMEPRRSMVNSLHGEPFQVSEQTDSPDKRGHGVCTRQMG